MIGYQVMPRLTPEEYNDLEQDIIENGVQVPIIVSPDGKIIDGHHRDEIARKHALHCPRRTIEGDDLKLRSMAYSLNLHRRHLNREQKRDLIAQSLKDDPQLSNREHERRTGMHKNTVQIVREELESTGQIAQSSERVSGDGRVRPASQPTRPVPEPEEPPQTDSEPPQTKRPATQPTASNILQNDLDALNTPQPDGDFDEKEHLTKIMIELRKAAKSIKETIHLAQHLDFWDGPPLSGDLRELLDELDSTLASGGFNAELARLTKEGNQ